MFVLIAIITIISALCYVYGKQTYSYWEKRKILTYPGASLPFGNLKNIFTPNASMMGLQFQDYYNYFKEKGLKHGGAYIFQQPVYVPVEPELMKMIMTKDYSYFDEKGIYFNEKDQPINGHLFNIGGDRWKNLRVKLTPTFTSGKMKTMYPSIVACSVPMVDKIEEHVRTGEPIDIKEMSARFTTDVIGTCAFGIDCNSFKNPDSDFRYYGNRLINLTLQFKMQLPFTAAFPKLGAWLKMVNFPHDIANFYTKITTDTVEYRENNQIKRNDLLQLMLEMKQKAEIGMQEIVSQAFLFFIAGFETSSSTMTHLMLELCINTDLQEKARQEVQKVLKQHNNEMTYECVNDMKYLEQCINETLRKYPALPVLNRECTKAYKVPGTDVVLEEGTKVFIPLMGIHYDPEYYPDPQKFDPERFTEENKKTRHPYTWMPFGEGPRICIGLRFGVLQAKIGLIQLLTRYRFTFAKKIQYPVKFKNGVLVQAAEDIILNVEKL